MEVTESELQSQLQLLQCSERSSAGELTVTRLLVEGAKVLGSVVILEVLVLVVVLVVVEVVLVTVVTSKIDKKLIKFTVLKNAKKYHFLRIF